MLLQGLSLWFILIVQTYAMWLTGALFLGIGTAMVYPTILASISDVARPEWRATSMGVYRFWRDSGYAFGAILAGVFADVLSVTWAIGIVGALPILSGILSLFRMDDTLSLDE